MAAASSIHKVVDSIKHSLHIDDKGPSNGKNVEAQPDRPDSGLSIADNTSNDKPDSKTVELSKDDVEYRDVVIAGAGPAGLLLATMLGRHSRGSQPAPSFICVEPQFRSTPAGHADGLNARSIEMFKSLGLLDELLQHAVALTERAVWAEAPSDHSLKSSPESENGNRNKAARKMIRVAKHSMGGPNDARSYNLIGLRQGKVEDVLSADVQRSMPGSLLRGFLVVDVRLDEVDATYPVVVDLAKVSEDGSLLQPPQTRRIRCRHLVGADGAHSTVRKKVGIVMEGDSTDQVFGVVDLPVDTDFPDIRRVCQVQNESGMIMVIPREQDAEGEWLTRFYVDMKELEIRRRQQAAEREAERLSTKDVSTAEVTAAINGQQDAKAPTIMIKNTRQRSTITEDDILQRIEEIFAPFRMQKKAGTHVNWSTSYAIGQRVASEFIRTDFAGMPRVFLVGDACHTHSPKLGQGMNVSMADSYNLAWKLTRSISPVSPLTGAIDAAAAANSAVLLHSYATERRAIAQRLIDIDRQWYALAWSADRDRQHEASRHQEADALLDEIITFASGLGIVYSQSFLTHPSTIVSPTSRDSAPPTTDGESQELANDADPKSLASEAEKEKPFSSPAQPGRRLANRLLTRLANSEPRDLHDQILPNLARFFVLIFTGRDILNTQSQSSKTVQIIFERILPKYNHYSTTCEAKVVTPEHVLGADHGKESEMTSIHDIVDPWTALPACVKRSAEMETFSLSDAGYEYYGLNSAHSTVVVVRPDGWVGARFEVVGEQEGSVKGVEEKLDEYLGGIFRRA